MKQKDWRLKSVHSGKLRKIGGLKKRDLQKKRGLKTKQELNVKPRKKRRKGVLRLKSN